MINDLFIYLKKKLAFVYSKPQMQHFMTCLVMQKAQHRCAFLCFL